MVATRDVLQYLGFLLLPICSGGLLLLLLALQRWWAPRYRPGEHQAGPPHRLYGPVFPLNWGKKVLALGMLCLTFIAGLCPLALWALGQKELGSLPVVVILLVLGLLLLCYGYARQKGVMQWKE